MLIRHMNVFEGLHIDYSQPVFCDTETCEKLGVSDGGLYGDVRLFQIYQDEWENNPAIIDCFFIPLEAVLEKLQPAHTVFHNASYDLHTINCATPETWIPRKIDDTLYMSRLHFYTENRFNYYKCLDYAGLMTDELRGVEKGDMQTKDWGGIITPDMLMYAGADVTYLAKLYNIVKDVENMEVYKLDIDNLRYALEYDRHGLPINQESIHKMKQDFLVKWEKANLHLGGRNPNSPKQMCEWLGTSSSNAYTLGELILQGDERAQHISDARKYSKGINFLNKYDKPFIKGFHNPCGTITGRMSCTGGHRYFYNNLQQPPKYMFSCIEAPDGYTIVYKDYSGLELRMAVAQVGDPVMSGMMMRGMDLHTYTGCYLFDRTPETLTKEERIVTKFYNFGTIYGAFPPTLMALLRSDGGIDITIKEVTRLRNKWLEYYEYFDQWHIDMRKAMKQFQFIDTVTELGRVVRAYTINDALNFGCQGSASEVTKYALKLLHERYDPYVINVVHDSIAVMCPTEEGPMWVERMNECMIEAWYYVIKDTYIPDLVMPAEAKASKVWNF